MKKYIHKFNAVTEQYSGATTPTETLNHFIERAKSEGATYDDIIKAATALIDNYRGRHEFDRDVPQFTKGSGGAIAIKNLVTGIDSANEDGYSLNQVYSELEAIIPQETSEMAIVDRDSRKEKRIEIDLSGPEGNVFVILKTVKALYNKLHHEEMDGWRKTKELMAAAGKRLTLPSPDAVFAENLEALGSYDAIVKKVDELFGDYVVFYK